MKRIVCSLLILLLAGATSLASPSASNDERAKELQKERERFDREKDPVDKAKIGIRISDLLLEDIAEAVKDKNFNELNTDVMAYTSTIETAHQTLVESGRDAQKKSGGFRDLEIALRKQTLRLSDYARMLTIDRREPLEQAKKLADAIRSKLLKALFP
jgi:hypothetical protein